MDNKELKLRFIIFFSIAFLIITFLFLHGTIPSGFHFVDNHEVVQINKDLSDANGNIIQVISKWVNNDLGGRFRPMYMIDNVIVYSLFQGNFFSISLFHAILHIFIAFFLFLFLRKLNFRIFESIIFPMIALIGDQTVIWWRLGPNESIGMWYLSLTLVFMIYSIKTEKRNTMFRVLFCISGMLTILCKESFLLLTPAIILTYIALVKSNSKSNSFLEIIKKYYIEFCVFAILFSTSIYFILTKVNTENLGYAGIKGVNPMLYITTFGKLFSQGGIGIAGIAIFCLSIISTIIWGERSTKKRLIVHTLIFTIALLIALPQAVLYAKSGIFERYFLPGMLAWALMLAYSLKNIKELIELKFSKKISTAFFKAEVILIAFLIIPKIFSLSKEATLFTNEGKEVNTVLSLISENIRPSQTIVFIADPITDFERTISFRRFLNGTVGINKIYTLPVMPINPDAFGQLLIHDFSWTMGGEEMNFSHLVDKKSAEALVIFPLLREKGDSIIFTLGYNLNEFDSYKIGSYQVYLKKKNNLNSFFSEYNSESILPISKQETIYKEKAFFPEKSIQKGDSVQIIIHPATEIKAPMSAFVILLDQAHPEIIAIHQQIFGNREIKISKLVEKDIEKPWLIYRNWGKEQAIPMANISIRVKRNNQIFIPIR